MNIEDIQILQSGKIEITFVNDEVEEVCKIYLSKEDIQQIASFNDKHLKQTTDEDIIKYLKQLHDCHMVVVYGEYVLTGNSEEEIIDKKRKVDNGSTLGFYLKKHLISIIGK